MQQKCELWLEVPAYHADQKGNQSFVVTCGAILSSLTFSIEY